MENINESKRKPKIILLNQKSITFKIALISTFTAVGVVLSYLNPFAYTTIFGAKPNPFSHLINGLTGVILGPFYSILTATLIAIIRFSLGIGSILAFPGGISGAIVVGFFAKMISKTTSKYKIYASLAEPIGTVFIGGTISNFIIPLGPIYSWWGIFAVSSIIGSILAFICLKTLEKKWVF